MEVVGGLQDQARPLPASEPVGGAGIGEIAILGGRALTLCGFVRPGSPSSAARRVSARAL
jgi:hypothetical protein